MKKKQNVLVNFILDASGSMTSVREATIGGFNEYISTLRKEKGVDYIFSLTLFDTTNTKLYKAAKLSEVKDLNNETYRPNGMTALYDAVCQTIKEVEAKAKKSDKVITVIMTDGQENSSKEYTEKEMKALIEGLQKGNWTFVYLGANQDSYAAAQKYGIGAANTANFFATTTGTRGAFTVMASATNMSANSAQGAAFFNAKDKKDLDNK